MTRAAQNRNEPNKGQQSTEDEQGDEDDEDNEDDKDNKSKNMLTQIRQIIGDHWTSPANDQAYQTFRDWYNISGPVTTSNRWIGIAVHSALLRRVEEYWSTLQESRKDNINHGKPRLNSIASDVKSVNMVSDDSSQETYSLPISPQSYNAQKNQVVDEFMLRYKANIFKEGDTFDNWISDLFTTFFNESSDKNDKKRYTFHFLACEHAVYNPFAMYRHSANLWKFTQFKVDFVGVVLGPENHRKGVVIGDYKVLSENTVPVDAINSNFREYTSKLLAQIVLFELCTSIKVTHGLLYFLTRQTDVTESKHAYTFLLSVDEIKTSNFQESFDAIKNLVLEKPFLYCQQNNSDIYVFDKEEIKEVSVKNPMNHFLSVARERIKTI